MAEKSSGKLNLYQQFQLFYDGKEEDLQSVPNASLYPLLNWFSFHKENLEICNYVNKRFFYVNAEILKYILYYKIDVSFKYIKYLKQSKDDGKLDFLKDYLMKYFGWSGREYSENHSVILKLLQDNNFKKDLVAVFGMDASECKKLGIEYKKEKIVRPKDTGTKSLFSFVG